MRLAALLPQSVVCTAPQANKVRFKETDIETGKGKERAMGPTSTAVALVLLLSGALAATDQQQTDLPCTESGYCSAGIMGKPFFGDIASTGLSHSQIFVALPHAWCHA